MIKIYDDKYFSECIKILIETYNIPPWYETWTVEIAAKYLLELIENKRFYGIVLIESDELIGCAFCHLKTYHNGEELYIDEFFISPDNQRKGYGKLLMSVIDEYADENAIKSITLLTGKNKPAYEFYKKCGFTHLESLAFMYK